MGIADAHLDEHGYVYATIPANTDKKVPVICFCSHVDTSPDCTGTNVKPQIVPQLSRRRHRAAGRPDAGHPRRGASGTARPDRQRHRHHRRHDAARRRRQGGPRRNHGRRRSSCIAQSARSSTAPIKILFTPDEEIGRGVDKADLQSSAPTSPTRMDGETAGRYRGRDLLGRRRRRSPSRASPSIPALPRAGWRTRSRSPPPSSTACPGTRCRRRPPKAARASSTRSRIYRHAGDGHAQLHRARFHRGGPAREKEALLERIVKRRDAATIRARRIEIEVTQQYRNMKQVLDRIPRSSTTRSRRSAAPALTPVTAASAAAPMARGCRSWACPAPTSSPANMRSIRRSNGSAGRTWRRPSQTIVHLAMIWEQRS